MNLLVRSLSPSGQQSVSSPVASSSRSRTNHRTNEHSAKSRRNARHLSSSGYTQPHMLFHLDADPVADISESTPTSPRSYPWSRFQKQKASSNRPYYDSFASAPSPEGNFDYYEYFCNYGKLSSSASASPIVSPDDPWQREGFSAPDPRLLSRHPSPGPESRSRSASFRPSSLSLRKLFRRTGPPSPSSHFPVHDDQSPDSPRPPMPGFSRDQHYLYSRSSPPSPLPAVTFDPRRAGLSRTASSFKRYFSSPADSSGHLVMPCRSGYDVAIHPMPSSAGSVDNPHSYPSHQQRTSDPGMHTTHQQFPASSYHKRPSPPDRRSVHPSLSQHRPREASLDPHGSCLRPESYQRQVIPANFDCPQPDPSELVNDLRLSEPRSGTLYRMSFIETNVYIPQDVPASSSSPEHMPSHRFHKHLHGEWVTDTVEELKKVFKPPASSILVNVEKKSKYPFIIFGPLSTDLDTRRFVPTASSKVLSPELRINDGIYDVCGSIYRPGSGYTEEDASAEALGFVISAFQTFPGEDSERLEENWITWTGAQMLYKYLPISAGLRKLVFYKRHDLHLLKHQNQAPTVDAMQIYGGESALYPVAGTLTYPRTSLSTRPLTQQYMPDVEVNESEAPLISYVLLCECLSLSESILTSVCAVIDQLRARCCGYSALYINCSLHPQEVASHRSRHARHPSNPPP